MTVYYRDARGKTFSRDYVDYEWTEINREAFRMGWTIECFIPFPELVAGLTQGEISQMYGCAI